MDLSAVKKDDSKKPLLAKTFRITDPLNLPNKRTVLKTDVDSTKYIELSLNFEDKTKPIELRIICHNFDMNSKIKHTIWLHKKIPKHTYVKEVVTLITMTETNVPIYFDILPDAYIRDCYDDKNNCFRISVKMDIIETLPISYSVPIISQADTYELDKKKLKEQKEKTGFIGFSSNGLFCYIHSTIQWIFHVPLFKKMLFDIPLDIAKTENKDVIFNTQRTFYQLMTKTTTCSLQNLASSFGWRPNTKESITQRDAEEFFNLFINKIEEQLEKTQYENEFFNLFKGETKITYKVPNLNYEKVNTDYFLDIPALVVNENNMMETLTNFTQDKEIPDYHTEEGNHTAIQKTEITHLPPILVLHLLRFEFDKTYCRKKKVSKRYEFPTEIDMSPYTTEEGDQTYDLFSVIVHGGSIDSGHYITYTHINGKWIGFDETAVEIVDEKTAVNQTFEGSSRCAYLVIYIKRSMVTDKTMFFDYNISDIPKNLVDVFEFLKKQDREIKKSQEVICNVLTTDSICQSVASTVTSYSKNPALSFRVPAVTKTAELYKKIHAELKRTKECSLFNCTENGNPRTYITPSIAKIGNDSVIYVYLSDDDDWKVSYTSIPIIIKTFFEGQSSPVQYVGLENFNIEKPISESFKRVSKLLKLSEDTEYLVYHEMKDAILNKLNTDQSITDQKVDSTSSALIYVPILSDTFKPFDKYNELCNTKIDVSIKDCKCKEVSSCLSHHPLEQLFMKLSTRDISVSDVVGNADTVLRIPLYMNISEAKEQIAKAMNENYNPMEDSFVVYENPTLITRNTGSYLSDIVHHDTKSDTYSLKFHIFRGISESMQSRAIKITVYCFEKQIFVKNVVIPVTKESLILKLLQFIQSMNIFSCKGLSMNVYLIARGKIKDIPKEKLSPKTSSILPITSIDYLVTNLGESNPVLKVDYIDDGNKEEENKDDKVIVVRHASQALRMSDMIGKHAPFFFRLKRDEKFVDTMQRLDKYIIREGAARNDIVTVFLENPGADRKLVQNDMVLYDLVKENSNLLVLLEPDASKGALRIDPIQGQNSQVPLTPTPTSVNIGESKSMPTFN